MSAGGGAFAAPAGGLDAEQVVAAVAVVATDMPLAPAGFQRCLCDQGARVHAQFAPGAFGMRPDAGDETFRCVFAQLIRGQVGGGGIHGIAALGGGDLVPAVVAHRPVGRGKRVGLFVRVVTAECGMQIAGVAACDQIQRLCLRRHVGRAFACAQCFQWVHIRRCVGLQRRCCRCRGAELVGARGGGRGDAAVQCRLVGCIAAAELARDHRRQPKTTAARHRLGHALVVHLAEHLVFAGEQRVAEAGFTHAFDQHLRELPFELACDLVDLGRIVGQRRVQFQWRSADAHVRSPQAQRSMRRPA
ncbi:hypothetical protein D3C71_1027240 [compost metagenome]